MKSESETESESVFTHASVEQWLSETSSWGLRTALEYNATCGFGREVCGFIDSEGNAWPMFNAATHPRDFFAMQDDAVLWIHQRVHPLKIVAVYHSHPRGPLAWSERDRKYFPPNLISVLIARVNDKWEFLIHDPSAVS
jgi:proteasome lid subunit RPN8/RPN11